MTTNLKGGPVPKTHLTITQAGVTSALVTIVGWIVAFIPAFGPDKQALIAGGSTLIAAVFMLANAGHKLADSNVSVADVKAGAVDAARLELSRVDFNGLVQDAVESKGAPDVSALVQAEVQRVLAGLLGQAAAPQAGTPLTPLP